MEKTFWQFIPFEKWNVAHLHISTQFEALGSPHASLVATPLSVYTKQQELKDSTPVYQRNFIEEVYV